MYFQKPWSTRYQLEKPDTLMAQSSVPPLWSISTTPSIGTTRDLPASRSHMSTITTTPHQHRSCRMDKRDGSLPESSIITRLDNTIRRLQEDLQTHTLSQRDRPHRSSRRPPPPDIHQRNQPLPHLRSPTTIPRCRLNPKSPSGRR